MQVFGSCAAPNDMIMQTAIIIRRREICCAFWKWEGGGVVAAAASHCYLNIFSTRSYCFFIQNYSNARVYLWWLCVEEPGIKRERADLHINHENEEIKSGTVFFFYYTSVFCVLN